MPAPRLPQEMSDSPPHDTKPDAYQGAASEHDTTYAGAEVQPSVQSVSPQLVLPSQIASSACVRSAPADPDISDREEGHTMPDFTSFVEHDGRTYHGFMHEEYNYLLPNDGAEQDRLDFQHAVFTMILGGKLYLAPISQPKYVLDIGTGTGIWAVELAKKFPTAHVIGTDLSMIQPLTVPSNVEFYLENSETQEWVFPQPFDFVHMRAMLSCFDDMKQVLRKAYRHMSPGGWIEMVDPTMDVHSPDGTASGTAIERHLRLMVSGAASIGRDLNKARQYKGYLTEAGFENVEEKIVPYPGGPWLSEPRQKKLGLYVMHNFLQLLDGTRKLVAQTGLSPEDLEKSITEAKADLKNPRVHFYCHAYVIYGQKPADVEPDKL